MAKGSGNAGNIILGILAIIAGVLVLWGKLSITLIIGIFLIIYGIIVLVKKS